MNKQVWCMFLAASCLVCSAHGQAPREIPKPLPDHPGNVYVEGESVRVQVPPEVAPSAVRWAALDDRSTRVVEGSMAVTAGGGFSPVELGNLGVGWYEVEFLDAESRRVGWTTAAVLASLAAPIPGDSPMSLDAAISWFAQNDPTTQDRFASLAALAGANWIRDRLRWRELEPERGSLPPPTQYDEAARIQARHGLNVLQVWHDTPQWAEGPAGKRNGPPADLRDVYAFCKAMAGRFQGTVAAWEPWNEANSPNFGGWTIDELCSYQKAAYLGFKAGDPSITVGWQPIAGANSPGQAEGIIANETWPYYDTYSIHSYDWPDAYERLWEPARQAACGRPIWVTECDRGMHVEEGSTTGDYTPAHALRKAEFIAQSYATSLFCGASRHFHFILGHYLEQNGKVQFGLLRKDLTPRPSYVALAAVGRFLAGARCLGRLQVEAQPDAHVYAFRAKPGGAERDVLVVWYQPPGDWDQRGTARLAWPLPDSLDVESVFDYLGRRLDVIHPQELASAPIFVVMPAGACDTLTLDPPRRSEARQGDASPVVLQLEMANREVVDKTEGWTPQLERAAKPGAAIELRIVATNFGERALRGTVAFEELPAGWEAADVTWDVRVEPMGREVLVASMVLPDDATNAEAPWIRVKGRFAGSPDATLAFRVYREDTKASAP
ncbi:MAG: hypothetical protein IT365_03430 [Candidatus Hydrogenedentes bacterium]|nr:hypothetical protein [Candidatus Hydrogenedentota bacterium]